MKLIKNLMKKFLRPKKTRATVTVTLTPMSEICQFAINDRLGYFDQLTIAMEIVQIVCNNKTDKTDEKIAKA